MTSDDLARHWGDRFGLAVAPLFESEEGARDGFHHVLLDSGFGSFALSVSAEELWRKESAAHWAWSSNLPHHVTVTSKTVAITRWDRPRTEVLTRASVEAQIESFYEYLVTDRVRSSQRVVDYVLGLFKRIRTLVADSRIPDEQSIDAFLAFLARVIEKDERTSLGARRVSFLRSGAGTETLGALPANAVEALLDDVLVNRTAPQSFRLFPGLAVRHAGSEIFQEAHFELLRVPGPDLFGYAEPAESTPITRGGAHFTPPALARTVVEQTLVQISDLAARSRLIILDPACGSGAFLHEAVRTLRRFNFGGEVVLIGRDNSTAAISMADFITKHAAADWSPPRGIRIDLQVADSLADPLPEADVVLMNPPFVSWSALDNRQRDQMRQVLGLRLEGRGDLSMAFVTRALDAVAPGGALGVLLPSSLLTLQAAEAWRTDLLDKSDLRLLASLGDYGLFAYALVQVAAAVFAKPSASSPSRRMSWRLFEVPTLSFKRRPTWRLVSPKTEAALSRLIDAGTPRISDLFTVRQGVRTGDNRTFIFDSQSFASLPAGEKRFFRPAVMNDSVQDGRLLDRYWVFYPHDENGPVFESESALLKAVPAYAGRYLIPNREALERRASISKANCKDWWGLSRSRASSWLSISVRGLSQSTLVGRAALRLTSGPRSLLFKVSLGS